MSASLNETRMKMLGEFAELALVLARDLKQSALTAETPEEKTRYAEAFHKVGRGLRQSLALHERFERGAVRAAREDASEVRAETQRQAERRKAQVRAPIERLIWTEYEDSEAEHLRLDLEDALEAEACSEAFLSEPLEAQIARICQLLDLPSPIAGEGGPGSGSDEGSTTLSTGPP